MSPSRPSATDRFARTKGILCFVRKELRSESRKPTLSDPCETLGLETPPSHPESWRR